VIITGHALKTEDLAATALQGLDFVSSSINITGATQYNMHYRTETET